MFDPEKITKYHTHPFANMANPVISNKEESYVLASDYDQLLALYRKLADWADSNSSLPQNLWSNHRCAMESGRQRSQQANDAAYSLREAALK